MPLEPLPFHLVNAFLSKSSVHSGNQAAVVIFPSADDPRQLDDEYKRLVARDFNFAETAFVVPIDVANGVWGLRWWTPAVEVSLCGHATLAAASALFSLYPDHQTLTFQTRWVGELKADLVSSPSSQGGSPDQYEVEISLPSMDEDGIRAISDDLKSQSVQDLVSQWGQVTGRDTADVKNAYKFLWSGKNSIIIELDDSVDLAKMPVEPKNLVQLAEFIVIVTQAMAAESTDTTLRVNSRVFGPGVGVDEDPVTGAAHAYMTPYYLASNLRKRLPGKLAQQPSEAIVIDAQQLSERGGGMKCRWVNGRAKLVGRAFRWGKGELSASPE